MFDQRDHSVASERATVLGYVKEKVWYVKQKVLRRSAF
jgi:hypothetical protein